MSRFIRTVGRKGQPTYTLDGKFIYSAYDPFREADSFVKQNVKPNHSAAVTICGADFINNALAERGYTTIISFDLAVLSGGEPDFEPFAKNAAVRRVQSIQQAQNILLENGISAADIDILIWTPYISAYENADTAKLLGQIKDMCLTVTASKTAADTFGELEERNAGRNIRTLGNITYMPPQNVCDTAVIVASGASLSDYLELLRTLQSKALILALPSSVKYLHSVGIEPDYVIAVDPGYATLYHLCGLKSETALICPLSINPAILRLPNITPIFFSYENETDRKVFAGTDVIRSCSEGSVVFNAVRIVRQLGAKNVILMGQDFSFCNHRSHVPGGYFETEYFGQTGYYDSLDKTLLELRCRKEPTVIKTGDRMLDSDVSLKIYMDHLLRTDFGVRILLPDNAFNPLDNRYETISVSEAAQLCDVEKAIHNAQFIIHNN
ncbi:MAG: DUF115 domain-containing protein [Spirochaetales bacterium]|nr:DUF115 domain-containing protein [Spirochaetales bacterium]MBR6200933.1 DUF115 domain-containing protein [Spirochaetales bacterium]